LPPEPLVLTNTVSSILPSPDYANDGTLLATINGWPARSRNKGDTWQRLRGGLPEFGEYRPTVALAFSPAFADDGRLFAGIALGETHGEGVYCSEDGGDTWRVCSSGLGDLRVYRVQPSPEAQDRTLLAYARTPQGDALYRSTDEGEHWRLELRQTESGRPPLPSLGELFYRTEYEPQIQCDYQGTCLRSDDGGQTWEALDTTGAPLESVVKAQFSPQYAQDGMIYILTDSDLFRYREQGQSWARCQAFDDGAPVFGERGLERYLTDLAVAASGGSTHDLLIGSGAGEFYRIPNGDLECTPLSVAERPRQPLPTPLPTPCSIVVDDRLVSDGPLAGKYGSQVLERIGCATAPAVVTGAAVQSFEGGTMLWREDAGLIYVLPSVLQWASFEDTWESDQPEPDVQPPAGLYAPVRGFGKLWREELEGQVSALGWATAPERGATLLVQRFAKGLLLYNAEEDQFWVLYEDGTWSQGGR
jgi:hypothetical protein